MDRGERGEWRLSGWDLVGDAYQDGAKARVWEKAYPYPLIFLLSGRGFYDWSFFFPGFFIKYYDDWKRDRALLHETRMFVSFHSFS